MYVKKSLVQIQQLVWEINPISECFNSLDHHDVFVYISGGLVLMLNIKKAETGIAHPNQSYLKSSSEFLEKAPERKTN